MSQKNRTFKVATKKIHQPALISSTRNVQDTVSELNVEDDRIVYE